MQRKKAIFFTLLFICFIWSGCQKKESASEKPIKIGYMICNSLPESKSRFEPISAYLQEKLERPIESIYINTANVEDAVQKKEVDFTHTNSILYVIFKEKYNAALIAGEVRGRYKNYDAGTIISRKGSGITKLSDIKGKSMIFGPALAPLGYLSQYDLMLKNGIDPEEDLAFYNIPWGAYKHEKVIYGVLFGAFDVGAAPRIDVDHMVNEGKINLDDFNIISENDPIPYCTFAAMAHVEPELVTKVTDLLLNITQEETALVDGEVLKVLQSVWVERFVEVQDKEYDSIRKMLKNCNMSPYEEY